MSAEFRRALACLALVCAACGDSAPESRPRDLLLITVDTLRPDFVSAYGQERPRTPTIDGLASRGVLYERAYSASPMTGPSHASMFSGLVPAEHGLKRNGRVIDEAVPWLPRDLQELGYSSAGVVGAKVLDQRFGFQRGFDHFDDAIGDDWSQNERRASEGVAHAIEWLEQQDEGPVFLWVHVYDPHAPYEAELAGTSPRGGRAFYRRRIEALGVPARDKLIGDWRDYGREVRYTDGALAPLLEAWEARGPESVICLTSDHGEGLGEHGYMGHGRELWEEQLLVPLIVVAPELTPGTRYPHAVSLVDLAATLWGLCVPELPSAFTQSPWPRTLEDARPRDLLIAERPEIIGAGLRPILDETERRTVGAPHTALIEDVQKYVWRRGRDDLYFDLIEDPHEKDGSLEGHEAEVEHLRARHVEHLEGLRILGRGEALDDADTRAMLNALGYDG